MPGVSVLRMTEKVRAPGRDLPRARGGRRHRAHAHRRVLVFEPPPGGGPRARDLRGHLGGRLAALPRYRQRLSEPHTGRPQLAGLGRRPGSTSRDTCGTRALPAPGGDGELNEWAADFWSHRLDRSRPLWEMVLLDGLEGGAGRSPPRPTTAWSTASARSTSATCCSTPTPERGRAPLRSRRDPERRCRRGWLLAPCPAPLRGLRRGAARPRRRPRRPSRATRSSARARMAELIVRDELVAAPHTSLNVPIGGTRRLEVVRVSARGPQGDQERARRHGQRRRAGRGDGRAARAARGSRRGAAGGGLRAMVPVNIRSLRRAPARQPDHSLFVHLPVAERDPLAALRRRVTEAERGQVAASRRVGARRSIELAGLAPPVLTPSSRARCSRRGCSTSRSRTCPARGAALRLRRALDEVCPLVPLAADHSVGIAVFSYDGDARSSA